MCAQKYKMPTPLMVTFTRGPTAHSHYTERQDSGVKLLSGYELKSVGEG